MEGCWCGKIVYELSTTLSGSVFKGEFFHKKLKGCYFSIFHKSLLFTSLDKNNKKYRVLCACDFRVYRKIKKMFITLSYLSRNPPIERLVV